VQALDLYATIEPLIGFDTQYERLYARYLSVLKSLHITRVLDIGCGNGKLLLHLLNAGFEAQGIERSAVMVARARALGVTATLDELDALEEGSFDVILAVADVLNYIPEGELDAFFVQLRRVLKPEGFFLADINTLYGFESVAEGVMLKEDAGKFLAIEATFEKPLLHTNITLFTENKGHYSKEHGVITQYFHPLSAFKKIPDFRFHKSHPITLFSDGSADKTLFILQKT